MEIVFEKEKNTFYLHTDNTTYAFFVHQSGALVHLYYGKKIKGDLKYLYSEDPFSFAPISSTGGGVFSLDTAMLEISGYNSGDFRKNSIKIRDGISGNSSCLPVYSGYETVKDYAVSGIVSADKKDSETLIVKLVDENLKCKINLFYTVYKDSDVITRFTQIESEEKTLYIENIASLTVDFPCTDLYARYLGGGYYFEGMPVSCQINQGVLELSSVCGSTGHAINPAIMLYGKGANEDSGDVFSFNLAYSGNFCNTVQKNCRGNIRLISGINPEGFCYKLEKGEKFITPEAVMSYARGFEKNTHIMHDFIRSRVSPQKNGLPSVLFNTWEAKYFNISHEVMVEYAELSKNIGINLVVLDDGWTVNRNDDSAGLGDFQTDLKKFPFGIKGLCDEINKKGMQFGIWIEPEMVSPNAQVLKEHPYWYLHIDGRQNSLSRRQLVLDFSNPEVVDYVYNSIKNTLSGINISYVKWDMNRYLTEVGSSYFPEDRQGEIFHRYVLGVIDLYSKITALFPNAHFEGCSGGGGRFNLEMLRFNDTVWVSDNTDAYERIKTQFSNAYFYPPSVMSVHIGGDCQVFTGRKSSYKFRFAVALSGIMGVEFDIKKLSPKDLEELSYYIAEYKKYEELIVKGDYYRLTDTEDLFKENKCAFSFVSKTGEKAVAVYLQILGPTNKGRIRLKLKGLDENAIYALDGDIQGNYYGSALMYGGLVLPVINGDGRAVIVNLKKL